MKRFPPTRIVPLLVTLPLVAVPLTFAENGIEARTAWCQSGTCCPEEGSTCIIGDWQRADKYSLPKGGPCPDRP